MFPSRRIATSGGDVYQNSYSLQFDGSNDYVDGGNDSSLNWGDGDGTVACWFKTDDSGTSDIVLNGSYSTNGKTYALYVDGSSKIAFAIDDNNTSGTGGLKSVVSGTSVNDNIWRHVAGVRVGTNIRLYVDGVEDANSPTDITGYGSLDISDNLFFGAGTAGTGGSPGNFYQGSIDEVAIWNTALTSNQVKTLYNNREPFNAKNIALSSLKGYWRMGDGVLDARITNGIVADQVTPTLGSEMWDSNASTFVGGDTTTGSADVYGWTREGSNTQAIKSNELEITYDNSATGSQVFFTDAEDLSADLISGKVYKFQCDAYYNGGSSGVTLRLFDGSTQFLSDALTTTKTTYTFYFVDNGSVSLRLASMGASNKVYIDNLSLKPVNGNPGLMTSMASDDIVTDTH